MKKLMIAAVAAALCGVASANSTPVFDYKASVKHADLTKKTVKDIEGVKRSGYIKVIKSSTLTGYLVCDPTCPCTIYDPVAPVYPKAGFLVIQNKAKKSGVKLLPAAVYAKAWNQKGFTGKNYVCEGYLFAGLGAIANVATPIPAQVFGDDTTKGSYKLFGAYNMESSGTPKTFVETWMDAAGFGKAAIGDDFEEDCEFESGDLCIVNLSGSVIGGMWLCAETFFGEDFICVGWTKTSDVISGSWSIKANNKIKIGELSALEAALKVQTANTTILDWVKGAAVQKMDKNFLLTNVDAAFRAKWF